MKIQFFEGNAFTGTHDKPMGQIPIGNPALICFSESLFGKSEMEEIARQAESPMTTFIAPTEDNQSFSVRFYSPNGLEVDLCGHASIVVSYFVKHYINDKGPYKFNLNPAFLSGGNYVKGISEHDAIGIKTKYYGSEIIYVDEHIETLATALDIPIEQIEDTYKSELGDIIFILKNNSALRKAQPKFEDIISIGHSIMPHRTMVLSAPSSEKGFDYEARVFAPGIGVNEDIACGSVNCSLAPIWMNKLEKETVEMFYCTPDKTGKVIVGGVQKLNIVGDNITIRSNAAPAWRKEVETMSVKEFINSHEFENIMAKVSHASMIKGAKGFFDVSRC